MYTWVYLLKNAHKPSDITCTEVRRLALAVFASTAANRFKTRVQVVQLRLDLRLLPARLTDHIALHVADVAVRRLEVDKLYRCS